MRDERPLSDLLPPPPAPPPPPPVRPQRSALGWLVLIVRAIVIAVALIIAPSADPAAAAIPHLTEREVRGAIATYDARLASGDRYKLRGCRVGRWHAWCRFRVYPRGCGCNFEHARWYEWPVTVDARRTRLIVEVFFWGDHLEIPRTAVPF